MSVRTVGSPDRKAKKSYTHTSSPESVAFLEAMRKKQGAASVSAILEEIPRAVRREHHDRVAVDRGVTDYYGSLSAQESAEQTEWAELALREFPDEERA